MHAVFHYTGQISVHLLEPCSLSLEVSCFARSFLLYYFLKGSRMITASSLHGALFNNNKTGVKIC